MRQLFVYASLMTLLSAPLAQAADVLPCQDFAETNLGKVMHIFRDQASSEAQKRDQLSAVFTQAVDTDWIGRFILGVYWRQADEAQRQQFLTTYRQYLTLVYISKFKQEKVANLGDIALSGYGPTGQGEHAYAAKTLVKLKGEPDVHVDYVIDNASGRCAIHDIVIENVSLLVSGRSEFSALAANSGIAGVIAAMQKRIGAMSGQ